MHVLGINEIYLVGPMFMQFMFPVSSYISLLLGTCIVAYDQLHNKCSQASPTSQQMFTSINVNLI